MDKRKKQLLIKCLKLSTSPQDGEALAAIRRANHILTGLGLDWETVIGEPGTGYQETRTAARETGQRSPYSSGKGYQQGYSERVPYGGKGYPEILVLISNKERLSEKQRELITSIWNFYNIRRYMTLKQLKVVQDIYINGRW